MAIVKLGNDNDNDNDNDNNDNDNDNNQSTLLRATLNSKADKPVTLISG